MRLNASPAYGRHYLTVADMKADWEAGKDFRIVNGPYFSKRDTNFLMNEGYTEVGIFVSGTGCYHPIKLEKPNAD